MSLSDGLYFFLLLNCPAMLSQGIADNARRLHAGGGGAQMFGRAIHFQVPTNVSAGVHPRLRETARCMQVFFIFVVMNY